MRTFLLLALLWLSANLHAADWPQATGPNANFVVKGEAPEKFSVSLNQNILWRTSMPSTGQGTVIVSGKKVFVTSHDVIKEGTEMGSTILGLCLDAESGKELWRREIPGTRTTDLSSLFSDNTAASPVADQDRVIFTNVGGTVKCFDHDGKENWSHTWTPFGRHHARQHEPILHDGNLILMHAPRYDLPVSVTTKKGSQPLGRGKEYWTHLLAYDVKTGKRIWQAECGTSVHSNSMIGKLDCDRFAILTGRGGGHKPPEEPYGVSMMDAKNGKSIWDRAIPGYAAMQNACWSDTQAGLLIGKELVLLDDKSGDEQKRISLTEGVTVTKMVDNQYVTQTQQSLPKAKKSFTYTTNLMQGDYYFFRTYSHFLIGRVHLKTGKVEYLQVPVQTIRKPGQKEEVLWDKALKNDMKNAEGFLATQDKRNAGNGWGHVSAACPIVVGDRIYFPTMVGMVYVLQWNAEKWDADALDSISDLGPAGETWSLSSLSYSDGKLYARTLKEVICIGEASN